MKILGTKIDPITFGDLGIIVEKAFSGKCIQISKSNSEFIIRAYQNEKFQKLLNGSDLNIPDGIGVLWSAKYLSLPLRWKYFRALECTLQMITSGTKLFFNRNYVCDVIPERLSGIEALFTMLETAEKNKVGVFFFGARPEVLEKSLEILRQKFPKLIIAGSNSGYDFKDSEVIDKINNSGAKLLIVALGSPKQESWITENYDELKHVKVAVGEGGSFDAISGATLRAPKLIQKMSLEWMWRMFFAPNLTKGANNRYKRVWNAVPVFIYETVKWKIKNGETKI